MQSFTTRSLSTYYVPAPGRAKAGTRPALWNSVSGRGGGIRDLTKRRDPPTPEHTQAVSEGSSSGGVGV